MRRILDTINSSIEYLKKLNYILTGRQKRESIKIFFLIIMSSLLEMIGVSIIVPYVSALIEPEKLLDNMLVTRIVSAIGISSSIGLIVIMSIAVVCIYIMKNALLVFSEYETLKYQNNVQKELAELMLGSYLRRPYEDLLDINSAEVIRGIANDTTGIYYIIRSLFDIVSEVLTILLILAFLITSDFFTAFFLAAFSALIVSGIFIKMKSIVRRSGKVFNEATLECTKASTQAMNGIKEIFVTRKNERFLQIYSDSAEKQRKAQLRYRFVNTLPNRIMETLFIIALAVLILLKIRAGVDISSSISGLGALAVASFKVVPYISGISSAAGTIIYYIPSFDNVYNNINKAREYNKTQIVRDKTGPKISFDDEIVVKDIEWRYKGSDKTILSNLCMRIKKGEAIGIVGNSGAGKSTLADIVLGLLSPQKGGIEIDGLDCREIPESWSRLIGYIPQMPYVLDDTIRKNILFGDDPQVDTDDKIWKILAEVRLDGFVKELPEGLDTVVGERGVKLSGGQRQRLTIARVLFYNPKIILMDEATSALDSETEQAVMEAIEGLHGTKTLIIIAHRVTTLKMCDRIYKIHDGKAEEVDYEQCS